MVMASRVINYIEYPKVKILVDCGWSRQMSPNGVYNKKEQIKSLNSRLLYTVNQCMTEKGQTINEQLQNMNIQTKDLDYVILTHLDCNHANGLELVKDSKHIIVSNDEIKCANKKQLVNKIRYQKQCWKDVKLEGFYWNKINGPFQKSYDLFDDGSIECINIPGHCDDLCAVKVKNQEGKFVLLYSDGSYVKKSWELMITSGMAMNKEQQKISLQCIREQSLDKNCIQSQQIMIVISNHVLYNYDYIHINIIIQQQIKRNQLSLSSLSLSARPSSQPQLQLSLCSQQMLYPKLQSYPRSYPYQYPSLIFEQKIKILK